MVKWITKLTYWIIVTQGNGNRLIFLTSLEKKNQVIVVSATIFSMLFKAAFRWHGLCNFFDRICTKK